MSVTITKSETSASVVKDGLRASSGAIVSVGVLSLVLNILMLTGPMFMLQVYDRVLTSHSVPTLIALGAIAIVLYAFFGLFSMFRSWMTARIGSSLDHRLAASAFDASVQIPLKTRGKMQKIEPVRDLEQIRSFISGPGLTALFDLPFLPFYLIIVYLLHPMLGLLGTVGAAILVTSTLLHEWLVKGPTADLNAKRQNDRGLIAAARDNAEVLSAMGMLPSLRQRWLGHHNKTLAANQKLSSRSAAFSSFTKMARFMLQSGALALGAYLAIKGELSPGAMIASSIILSRALAPVEQVIGQWRNFVSARLAMKQLEKIIPGLEQVETETKLPAPTQKLEVIGLTVMAPGTSDAALKGIALSLQAGDAVGVIGSSGAGKTTLARALLGIWPSARGEIRLDGALTDQFTKEVIGNSIGYLPQDVELFDGTIAENIARFHSQATSDEIVEAAKLAGCHDMILGFAKGYDTVIGEAGRSLSGGQRQCIGLARAVFGKPFLIVLDEPNSNLDQTGEMALNKAILALRKAGSIVMIIAHRHSALASVNKVLALKDGHQAAFGPRNDVMEQLFANQTTNKGELKVVKK